MSDRFVEYGILVVYENGDQFFSRKLSDVLRFISWMEVMGYTCEIYDATIEQGKVSRRRWINPDTLLPAAKGK